MVEKLNCEKKNHTASGQWLWPVVVSVCWIVGYKTWFRNVTKAKAEKLLRKGI